MGLVLRRRRPTSEARSTTVTVEGIARQFMAMMGSGGSITVERAIRNAAAWACVRVLTSSASTLPLDGIRVQGNVRTPIEPTPPVLANPSPLVDRAVWLTQVFWSLNTDGNAFGNISSYAGNGLPLSIETIDPEHVTQRQVKDGRGQVVINNELRFLYPFGDVWHVPGSIVRPGSPFGLSPIEYAAKSLNTSLAAEDFGHGFLADGGHPSSIIYSDNDEDATSANAIKTAFLRATQGREPAVLGSGLKYEAIQTDPSDSQFIETMRFEVENVCRFFGVPPSMVYASVSGQSVTYANVSQADLAYLKHSLDPLLVRVETALSALLPRPQVARFNRGALLRADQASRFAMYATALQNGFMSVNEVRAYEDVPPFPGSEYDMPPAPGVTPPSTAPTGGN